MLMDSSMQQKPKSVLGCGKKRVYFFHCERAVECERKTNRKKRFKERKNIYERFKLKKRIMKKKWCKENFDANFLSLKIL